ncbi:MAG: polyprenyl synthetase family protein [Candidatus Latescibacteria bacterium]|nr:polyprenyl synthetase family protein [bacterium]MBD3424032.1 polyprenyl synthetase family protein [Candidatus Latescibacterota bacterium]
MKLAALNKIMGPIGDDLRESEEFLGSLAASDVPEVDEIRDHITRYRGKRLRPVLLLLCAGMTGGVTRLSIEASAALELLHTTTLIHDDVVDRSDLRRGGATVNALWGNRTAVLAGDIFFSRIMTWLVDLDISEITSIFSAAIRQVCEGELIQTQNGKMGGLITEEEYFKTISLKTASLISASCKLGVLTSQGGSSGLLRAAGAFGTHLGISFQIRDDLMDYNGRRERMGKPAARDIEGSILTLPLIYGLEHSNNGNRDKVLGMMGREMTAEEIEFIIGFADRSGGISYARERAAENARKALSCLEHFPGSEYRDSLAELTSFVIEREF